VIVEGNGGRNAWNGNGVNRQDLLIAVGQGICRSVLLARPVLHRDVMAEQLGDPGVLWYGGEALIEDVLEAPMVGADRERPTPQVRPPVPDGLH